MLNVIRYSQIIGLMAMDSTTTQSLGEVEEIWLDDCKRIAYFSSRAGYLPLEQIAGIGTHAVSMHGHLVTPSPTPLYRLNRLEVQSAMNKPLGWIDDFLFDWHTGQIAAYILAGDIAEPWGGRAVLYPEDVQTVVIDRVVLQSGSEARLSSEADGLMGFLSEKSDQVRHLVQTMRDRLHDLITPHDQPKAVHVKIQEVSNELATSGQSDHHALKEATDLLHDHWENLQQSIGRASHRTKVALESAWKQLTK